MVAEEANAAGEVMVGAAGEAPEPGAPESARTANAVVNARSKLFGSERTPRAA